MRCLGNFHAYPLYIMRVINILQLTVSLFRKYVLKNCQISYHDIKDFDMSEYIHETGKGNVLFNIYSPK